MAETRFQVDPYLERVKAEGVPVVENLGVDRPTADEPEGPDDHEQPSVGWLTDNLVLTTVGVDIGSSTSHLMFARIHLQRLGRALSNRFVVIEREVLARSPIALTPYLPDGRIDAGRLERFIADSYQEAGLNRSDVDTGAVIFTGAALERANAASLAALFAAESGKFVCASAGHNLEAALAAHGSGAVALSRQQECRVLNVDIGGGTSKLALIDRGELVATAAVGVGARLVALDPRGRVARIEPAARDLAAGLGLPLHLGQPLTPAARRRLVRTMAAVVRGAGLGGRAHPLAARLALTPGLPRAPRPTLVTFSGGVAEFLYGRADAEYGDLAPELAEAVRAAFQGQGVQFAEPPEGIRATVIGASQFTVQVSGSTIHVSEPAQLPLRNVPVARVAVAGEPVAESVTASLRRGLDRLDLQDQKAPVAFAIDWDAEPRYSSLRALAEGILGAHEVRGRDGLPLIATLTGDAAGLVAHILRDELGHTGPLIVLDGLELADFDFLDIGEVRLPANVVPVVVKSLVFPDAARVQAPELAAAEE